MRQYVVGVSVNGRLRGKGIGHTRASAEQSTPSLSRALARHLSPRASRC
jgi:hypothetical protein